MQDINLQAISKFLSERSGEVIELITIKEIGRGYHARGFKVSAACGKVFFIKKIDPIVAGLEHPERKLSSLLLGHRMAKQVDLQPKSHAVLVETNGIIGEVPDLSDETAVYHIQDYIGEGSSYASLIEERKDKVAVDERDEIEIENIVEYIAHVHSVKHASTDEQVLTSLYNDGLRQEVVHPELTVSFLHEIEDDDELLPPKKQGEYVALLLETIHYWKNRPDRLSALHGDFWGSNVFVRDDGSVWAIDYSRVPWGDPGIDIGKWMAFYVWNYHVTGNEYFKQVADLFLDRYIKKTGDEEMRSALCLGMIFSSGLYTRFSDYPVAMREKVFTHLCSILKNKTFSWDF